MFLLVLDLLAVIASAASSKCVDGEDNVIRIYDTTDGKGKILFKDVEVATYDKYKKPICDGGKPQFTFPGFFKLRKGTVEVIEGVDDEAQPLRLAITLEKNSLFVGVVCEKGKSKNQFVPEEMCMFKLCAIPSMCSLLRKKTTTPIDVTKLVDKEYIDLFGMSIPHISGEWQVSVDLIQGKNVVGGLRVGEDKEWVAVKNIEDGKHEDL